MSEVKGQSRRGATGVSPSCSEVVAAGDSQGQPQTAMDRPQLDPPTL